MDLASRRLGASPCASVSTYRQIRPVSCVSLRASGKRVVTSASLRYTPLADAQWGVTVTPPINVSLIVCKIPSHNRKFTVVMCSSDSTSLQARVLPALGALVASLVLITEPAQAKKLESVNKPELLPSEPNVRVIDVAGFLTSGQEARLSDKLKRLDEATGIKLRVLAQNYPATPGLAIKDYWGVDDDTIVLVGDSFLSGNLLNFNVGANADLAAPRNFWQKVSNKFGNKFYWQENGIDESILRAVDAIDVCLRGEVKDSCNP